ncbi:MAG: NHL repeat-containing protein [Planctomycetota bacterium]|jgi:uncharacterized protein YjiK
MKVKFIIASLAFFFALLVASPGPCAEEPSIFRVKYFFTIDGKVTGSEFKAITALYIDELAEELYILDVGSNRRVVVANLEGTVLYHFPLIAVKRMELTDIAVDKTGRIYLAGGKDVAVFDYKGEFQRYLDLSFLPEDTTLSVQSIELDEEGNIYLGISGAKSEIVTLKNDGELVSRIKTGDRFKNFLGLTKEDGFTFLDPYYFKVFTTDVEGNVRVSFGRVSSLLGGFSLPSSLAIHKKKDLIFILDSNRGMVIVFDREGKVIFEFGGTDLFNWPRQLAVDPNGRIYVADGTSKIRVFEVIEQKPESKGPGTAETDTESSGGS